jgi:hypothetical protein
MLLSIYLCIYLPIYHLSIRLSIYPSIYPSIHLSIFLSIYQSIIYLSSILWCWRQNSGPGHVRKCSTTKEHLYPACPLGQNGHVHRLRGSSASPHRDHLSAWTSWGERSHFSSAHTLSIGFIETSQQTRQESGEQGRMGSWERVFLWGAVPTETHPSARPPALSERCTSIYARVLCVWQ